MRKPKIKIKTKKKKRIEKVTVTTTVIKNGKPVKKVVGYEVPLDFY